MARRRQELQESVLNETSELRPDRPCNPWVVAEKHAEFDVPFMRGLRKSRGRDECGHSIDENALCVLAGRRGRSFLGTSGVVEHRWFPRPRPVIFPECLCMLFDCGVLVESVLFIWRDI